MDRGAWPFVGGVTYVVFSVSVREERREKTRDDEREEMKKCFLEKCLKTKKSQTKCHIMIRKKNPSDESVLRKFRILPVFSFVFMIRIRFFVPRE